MNILAIDPGNEQSAFVGWDGKTILKKGIMSNSELRANFPIIDLQYDWLAVEMVACYGMPVGAEVFETCVWIGRFIERWNGRHVLTKRLSIKQHLCHDSRAKDANIRQALIDRFGPPGVKASQGVLYKVRSHEWAALALAVYIHDTLTTTTTQTEREKTHATKD